MNKIVAEFIGTFTLVLFGCGAAVIAGADGMTGIGLTHITPAVSLGAFLAGRMSISDMIMYWIGQVAGGLAGALVLMIIMQSKMEGWGGGLGQNGWGAGYLGEYNMAGAFVFEVVATFLFLVVILGSTGAGAPGAMAGLAIGLALVVIHLVGINITGVSVNPARSIGPAVLGTAADGGKALSQLWLFIAAPMIGAAAAGILFRTGLLDSDPQA